MGNGNIKPVAITEKKMESLIYKKKLRKVYVIVVDNKKRIGEVDDKMDKVNKKVYAVDRKAETALEKVEKVDNRVITEVNIVDLISEKVWEMRTKIFAFFLIGRRLLQVFRRDQSWNHLHS